MACLLAPASRRLQNESEHVRRGLVRVAGSPELAQLLQQGCRGEGAAVPGGGERQAARSHSGGLSWGAIPGRGGLGGEEDCLYRALAQLDKQWV